jgi:hypothetical protein
VVVGVTDKLAFAIWERKKSTLSLPQLSESDNGYHDVNAINESIIGEISGHHRTLYSALTVRDNQAQYSRS